MSVAMTHENKDWPPGTVRIEGESRMFIPPHQQASFQDVPNQVLDLYQGDKIILQPRPTSDPNDPLVR